MLKIDRLYTQPALIAPILFEAGVNLILGEGDNSSDKTNGVGKSLCVEFINFALMKRKIGSRVSKIPHSKFPKETLICLDFNIGGVPCTIKRSIEDSENPELKYGEDVTIKFDNADDATRFLTEKLALIGEDHPSFRSMMGPLIRDERSEFKSIVSCFDTKSRIPDDYAPHLYLLGISTAPYASIKNLIKEIDEIAVEIRRLEEHVQLLRGKGVKDSRSDFNELDAEVARIKASIDNLENVAGYDLIKDDVIQLEAEIEELRREKYIRKQQLLRMAPISTQVSIDPEEVLDFYESLKKGLGVIVARNLEEVYRFKATIDEFQNQILSEKRQSLRAETAGLDEKIEGLDKKYREFLSLLDQEGNLKNLKQTYAAYVEKAEAVAQLRGFIDRHTSLTDRKVSIRSIKEAELLLLQSKIQEAGLIIASFEKTILSIHEYIQGNARASFTLEVTSKKQIVEMELRIDDDGSHSVEREKVFIYDLALLLNAYTRERHPGLLIHDNIFDVDQDTLIKSLKYLIEKAVFKKDQQYILTLNSDRLTIGDVDQEWLESLGGYTRAIFTKENRFLKTKYQEL